MGKKRNGKDICCKACSKYFYVPEYRIETAKFCSLECQNHKQYEKPNFVCRNCKKQFSDSPSRKGKRVFCTYECMQIFHCSRRQDVKKQRRESIQKLRSEGKIPNNGQGLRKYVFENKEIKCDLCGYNQYQECLDIHHGDGNPSNNELRNLLILCVMCHRKVHRKIVKIEGFDLNEERVKLPRKSDKIKIEDIPEIKRMLNEGILTHKEIANKYMVRRETITKINNNKRWNA